MRASRSLWRLARNAVGGVALAGVSASYFVDNNTVYCAPATTKATVAAATTVAAPLPPIVNPAKPGRRRIVVVGTGWASVNFLKSFSPPADVDVFVVSSRGYFLYNPMLPAAAVGSVEPRSIVESARSFLPRGATFYEANVESVVPTLSSPSAGGAGVITCRSVLSPDAPFAIQYDVLVLAPGSVTNTFGTPGAVEHALFLKSAEDAARLRARVHDAFERAALPVTSAEERARLLTFVICGGGPTGSELAAELRDLVKEDYGRLHPDLASQAKIVVIDSNSHVLSMFDRAIAEYTTQKFKSDGMRLVLNARVTAVEPAGVRLKHKVADATIGRAAGAEELIPAGTVVWATGIGLHPLAASLAAALGKTEQPNTRALTVDDRLRVRGSQGTIYALGDAATVEQSKALAHAAELFAEFDADKSGSLEIHELAELLNKAAHRFPQFREHVRLFQQGKVGPSSSSAGAAAAVADEQVDALQAIFKAADKDGSGALSLEEFRELLAGMDKHLRSLPATAQVASQQGKYLSAIANADQLGPQSLAPTAAAVVQPFVWKDMGSFAFIGSNEAVAKLPGVGVLAGWSAGALWRGFETVNQQSTRNRASVGFDMLRTRLFGRDVSMTRR